MIPLFALPFAISVVLASSTSGDQHIFDIVTLHRPLPNQDWGRARTAGSRFARDDMKLGIQLRGNNYPENSLAEPPRRDTSPQPGRHI